MHTRAASSAISPCWYHALCGSRKSGSPSNRTPFARIWRCSCNRRRRRTTSPWRARRWLWRPGWEPGRWPFGRPGGLPCRGPSGPAGCRPRCSPAANPARRPVAPAPPPEPHPFCRPASTAGPAGGLPAAAAAGGLRHQGRAQKQESCRGAKNRRRCCAHGCDYRMALNPWENARPVPCRPRTCPHRLLQRPKAPAILQLR